MKFSHPVKLAVLGGFIVIIGFVVIVTTSPSLFWKQYCFQKDNFCIKLPGIPAVRQYPAVNTYGWQQGGLQDGVYVLSVAASETPQQAISDAIKQQTANGSLKIVGAVKQSNTAGAPVTKVKVTLNEKGSGQAAFIFADHKVYIVSALGQSSGALDPSGLIDSFHFIHAPTQ
jgi:hypothetical protein